MKEILKGVTIYQKVDTELLNILSDILKRVGRENPIKIGDIVAMDEYDCRKSNYDEVKTIPKERIIQYIGNINEFKSIIVKNEKD